MSEKTVEEIKNVLEQLAKAAQEEAKEKYEKNKGIYQKKIPSFDIRLLSQEERKHHIMVTERVAELLEENSLPLRGHEILVAYVIHACSLDNYLQKCMPASCCVDRSHFLIDLWVKEQMGIKVGAFGPEFSNERRFFHPPFGTKEEWLHLITAYLQMQENPEKTEELHETYHALMQKKTHYEEEQKRRQDIVTAYYKTEYGEILSSMVEEKEITEEQALAMAVPMHASCILYSIPIEEIEKRTLDKAVLRDKIRTAVKQMKQGGIV